jgi:dolichol-phosphate mannosyltransferase
MPVSRTASVQYATRPFLSVVVLAYNEEANLQRQIDAILSWFDGLEDRPDGLWPESAELACNEPISVGEIVVVNDGSTDGTKQIAEAAKMGDKRVVCVHHSRNLGMGATVRSGYAASRGVFVTQLPADGQVGPSSLSVLLPQLNRVDVVFSVYSHREDGALRKVMSTGFQFFTRALYRQDGAITGTMMIRRTLLELFPTHANTFFANLELPFRLQRAGIPFEMVEIEAGPRESGTSKVVNPKRIVRVVREMIGIRLRHWK